MSSRTRCRRIRCRRIPSLLLLATLAAAACAATASPDRGDGAATEHAAAVPERDPAKRPAELRLATFAGGCFWCMESPFEKLPGVWDVVSGFAGGTEPNPTYEQVGHGGTGYTETVQIHYDPETITYEELLDVYWRQIDPTDAGGQFVDRGSQYRPEVFVHDTVQRTAAEASRDALARSGRFEKPIVVAITPYTGFWPAEEYHQDFHDKNPVHYQRYRWGSGRDAFREKWWGEEADRPPLEPARPAATRPAATRPAASGDAAAASTRSKPPDAELRRRLTELQYQVTQRNGTERAYRNRYWDNDEPGIYVDVVSGEPLFASTEKFHSGTGWPSFWEPLVETNIVRRTDHDLGYPRTEVRSTHGDSHLGHVFRDGPPPTGLRYCINSAALRFIPATELETEGYGAYAGRFAGDAKE